MSEQQPPAVTQTSQMPQSGQVSPDGQFMWDGATWRPITGYRWEPTDWTRPMQASVAAVFIVNGIWEIVVAFGFAAAIRESAVRQIQRSNPNLTPDQTSQALNVGLAFTEGFMVFLAVLFVLIGVLSLVRRWSWLFYVDLVILGLGIFSVLSGITSLARPAAAALPVFATLIGLALSVVGVGLAVWMLVARIQRGVWAARKSPVVA
ncbi:MAG: hypothetical protein E6J02_03080 [Chloroflexi bacterium]|nr:MAG: hypothetical protein E6J02_03080 [Chloroflexota bacterium]TME14172.1 MAG: hypothetical protein E6I63_13465 [Chloroflexota bacterium]